MERKERGKVLMNQKANSVADLAAVLLQQEKGPGVHRVERAKKRMERMEHLKRVKGEEKVKKAPVDVGRELGGVEGVVVRWADLGDLEFAERWPEAVVHDELKRARYTAAWPALAPKGEREAAIVSTT